MMKRGLLLALLLLGRSVLGADENPSGIRMITEQTDDGVTLRWHYHYQPYWQVGAGRPTTANDADYAMPFGPGRYVVLQGPRGTYSHFAGTGSENA